MPAKTKRSGWIKKNRQLNKKWNDRSIEDKQQDAIRYKKNFGIYPWEMAPELCRAEDWGFKSEGRNDILNMSDLLKEFKRLT